MALTNLTPTAQKALSQLQIAFHKADQHYTDDKLVETALLLLMSKVITSEVLNNMPVEDLILILLHNYSPTP